MVIAVLQRRIDDDRLFSSRQTYVEKRRVIESRLQPCELTS